MILGLMGYCTVKKLDRSYSGLALYQESPSPCKPLLNSDWDTRLIKPVDLSRFHVPVCYSFLLIDDRIKNAGRIQQRFVCLPIPNDLQGDWSILVELWTGV